MRGGGQGTDRDEVDACLGVCAHILEFDPTGTLHRDALFEAGTILDGLAHLFDFHVVEKQSFSAVSKRQLHFVERAHFNFDRLRSTTVMVGPLERRNDASGERDMVVLDEYPIGE